MTSRRGSKMFQLLNNYSSELFLGFKNTILVSVLALVFSLVIGSLVGIMQTSHHKGLRMLGDIYVEFFRNIPLLIIVMFFYVVVPLYWVKLNGFTAGLIGLTIYTSAFIADVVRSGIEAVPHGQMEAGLSQGFTATETMVYIIFPQAVRIVIPPLGNQFINLVKNSSILAMVAGLDLMYFGDLIASETFNTFDSYILVALFYLVLTIPLTALMQYLERRLSN